MEIHLFYLKYTKFIKSKRHFLKVEYWYEWIRYHFNISSSHIYNLCKEKLKNELAYQNSYSLLLISNNSKIKVIRPIQLDLIVKQFILLLNNKFDTSYSVINDYY